MLGAVDTVATRRISLLERLDEHREAWARAHPGAEPLPTPDLRTAAYVVAVSRCLNTLVERGIFP